jgi:HlyD family secretion protein
MLVKISLKKYRNAFFCIFLISGINAVIFSGCAGNNGNADAYGNFEAEEVVIGSESTGTILRFDVEEGDKIEKGRLAVLIDTIMPQLELEQLIASKESAKARLVQLQKSIDVQEERLSVLKKEADRITSMHKEKAVSTQKFDEVTGQYRIAMKELEQMRSQKPALKAELSAVETKIKAAREKLSRCKIVAPRSGIVLQKYAERGEFTGVGKPLLKMAETNELILRAYISGSQLDDVRIGQEVTVKFDKSKDDEHQRKGVVSWVASSAEFTPKIIQTKEERVDLVYAIKVRVPNPDGRIKIGMPGEVLFQSKTH